MLDLHVDWACEDGRVIDSAFAVAQVRDYVSRGQLVPLLAYDGGEAVACLNLLLFPDPLNAGGLIAQGDQLYIKADYRNQGLGTKMIAAGDAIASWLGATQIRCYAVLDKASYYSKALPPGYKAAATVFIKEI